MDDRSAAARQGLRLVTAPSTPSALANEDNRTSSGVIAAMPSTSIQKGVVVNGKYLVGNVIGEGGVGIVYEAQNLELDEKVALKCLRPEVLVDTAMVARFAREAKAAASIKSEYVATVHDVGTMQDGAPYMVMELLDGKDLGAVVQERGVLGPRASTEYALHVCEALAVAHAKGIVHRDIKPENLMLTERTGGMRIVKVLDFGISKAALTGSIFRTDLPLVKTVNLMGTPLYMSPEQVRSSDTVDVRSDIWSLGMVLYELLTGTTAFSASSITELCAAILESSPQPIELHRKDLPSGLVDVIHRCLEKDPTRRYQNVAELAMALMPFGPKRARLNVERAVAVLQGAGMLDTGVRVLSTMPPPTPDAFHISSSIPSAPRVPSVPGLTPPESTRSSTAALATSGVHATPAFSAPVPSAAASLPALDAVEAGGQREIDAMGSPRSRKFAVLACLAAAAIVLVGVAVFANGKKAATESATTTTTSTAQAPVAQAAVAPPAAPAPSPETTTAATADKPLATATGAGVTTTAATTTGARPATFGGGLRGHGPAPTGQVRGGGVVGKGGGGAPSGGATGAPTTAKTADEPDLGY